MIFRATMKHTNNRPRQGSKRYQYRMNKKNDNIISKQLHGEKKVAIRFLKDKNYIFEYLYIHFIRFLILYHTFSDIRYAKNPVLINKITSQDSKPIRSCEKRQ